MNIIVQDNKYYFLNGKSNSEVSLHQYFEMTITKEVLFTPAKLMSI
jgi:hypothetical protein